MNCFLKISISIFIMLLFSNCDDRPIKGNRVPIDLKQKILEMGILDKNEEIILFYPSYDNKRYGNFYTNKRIACYWLESKRKNENYVQSAYYSEIKSIELKYGDGFEFTSALIIELESGEKFNVYFNDTNENIDTLYKDVLKYWNK